MSAAALIRDIEFLRAAVSELLERVQCLETQGPALIERSSSMPRAAPRRLAAEAMS